MSPYLPKDQQKVNLLEKQKQLKELQTGIDRLMLSKITSYEQYVDGTIDKVAFLAVREKVAAEVEKLKHQMQKIEQEIQAAHEAMLSKESGIHEALTEQSLSTTLKKEWIDVLIETIYLNKDGSVQIEWSFRDLFDMDAAQKEYEVSA
jgi:predicted  nucleic acid-binding Zn-ribbon protein